MMLSDPNLNCEEKLRQMRTGTEGLDFFYALIKNPDLAMPAIPHLKVFITEDESVNPNSTVLRKVAAQVIFKTTGERVPYRGMENDRRLYMDPYDPSNHRSPEWLPNKALQPPPAKERSAK